MLTAVIALIFVTIGSFTDLRTTEVPDWLNYSLIAVGIALNLLFSIYYWTTEYILASLIGLLVSLAIGFGMYYAGQWGGGDSKMIFGLGALFGIRGFFDFYPKFLFNVLFAGALYGVLWVIGISIRRWKKVKPALKKTYLDKRYRRVRLFTGIGAVILMILVYVLPAEPYLKVMLSSLIIFVYFANYLLVLVKAVEDSAMIQTIPIEKLTEGDWIVEDVYVGKKRITGPKDLGISKANIDKLLKYKEQGKISTIKVKYGIPFVPSFLIALVFTIITDNIIIFLLI